MEYHKHSLCNSFLPFTVSHHWELIKIPSVLNVTDYFLCTNTWKIRILSIPKTTAVRSATVSSTHNHKNLPGGKSALVTLEIHKSLLTVCKQRSSLIAGYIINTLNLQRLFLGCGNNSPSSLSAISRQKTSPRKSQHNFAGMFGCEQRPAGYSPVLWH